MIEYRYLCVTCRKGDPDRNEKWIVEQRITEDALTLCPHCGASTSRGERGRVVAGPMRLIEPRGDNAPGFLLRGEDWPSKIMKREERDRRP